MTKQETPESTDYRALVRQIHDDLAERLDSPIIIGARDLTAALGYPSQSAFRQAHAQNTLPVRVFLLKQRRGYWAMTTEVAEYIARERLAGAPVDPTFQMSSFRCEVCKSLFDISVEIRPSRKRRHGIANPDPASSNS